MDVFHGHTTRCSLLLFCNRERASLGFKFQDRSRSSGKLKVQMNELSFCVLCLLLMIFVQKTNGSKFAPLVLSIQNGYYELDSLKVINNKVEEIDEKQFSPQAVYCCPEQPSASQANKDSKISTSMNLIEKIIRNKSDLNPEFSCSKKYEPTIRKISTSPIFTSEPNSKLVAYEIVSKVCKRQNESSVLPPLKNQCDFSQLQILYDEPMLVAKQVRYKIMVDRSTRDMDDCQDYKIGEDLLLSNEEIMTDIEAAYSKEKQEVVLKNIGFLLSRNSVSDNIETFPDPLDDKIYTETCNDKIERIVPLKKLTATDTDYLIPQILIPNQDFDDENLSAASCTVFGIVPMWRSVANGAWKQVKNFVRQLAAAIVLAQPKGKLSVISGTYGVMKYRTVDTQCVDKELYLVANKIPVPEALWTLVYYVTPDHGDIPGSTYGMIVVTDNRPVPAHYKICKIVVKCDTYKWQGVNEGITRPFSYCCQFHKDNLNLLGIKIEQLPVPLCTLNLKTFPWARYSDGVSVPKDLLELMHGMKKTNERIQAVEETSVV